MTREKLIELLAVRGVATREQLQSKYLHDLEQMLDDSNLARIRAEVESNPAVIAQRERAAQAEAENVWKQFFRRHTEIVDHAANRMMLFDRALSLSDDDVVRLHHLDEAASLPGLDRRKVKQALTAANEKHDEETLRKYCRGRFQFSTAALGMLRKEFGADFNQVEIDQALQSGLISLGPASQEQLAKWANEDAEKRQDYLTNHASDEELREAARVESEQRRQATQRAEQERQLAVQAEKDAASGFVPLPEFNSETGERIDRAYLNQLSTVDRSRFKMFIKKYGSSAVTKRLNGLG